MAEIIPTKKPGVVKKVRFVGISSESSSDEDSDGCQEDTDAVEKAVAEINMIETELNFLKEELKKLTANNGNAQMAINK